MPTYLEWDREVLEQCYEYVDALSLHRYIGNTPEETGGDSAKYLAMNLTMDRQIAETIAVCDYVRGRKRSPKKLWLSFDEWNVWYRARSGDAVNGREQEAPHLLEEVYNLEDALLVGGIINTLLRNADRVKLACLAQLVNVIAPIMTNANGLYRQTIYYPYNWGLQMARGEVLNVLSESPVYDVAGIGKVPYLDVTGTFSKENGNVCLFILNRDLTNAHEVDVIWEDAPPARILTSSRSLPEGTRNLRCRRARTPCCSGACNKAGDVTSVALQRLRRWRRRRLKRNVCWMYMSVTREE
jgi:alpha-N-arabinofuranosidase